VFENVADGNFTRELPLLIKKRQSRDMATQAFGKYLGHRHTAMGGTSGYEDIG